LLLFATALFMFLDARTPPIILWDESRLAVNALEMHLHGLGLVTTYAFDPDLWNTKPPLMIWLMALSADWLGPSELALRLPAMVSGMATLAVVFAFVRRITQANGPAALAVVLLAASVGFYGEHGARTGDYDALLCLFTTGYTCLLFFALHLRKPPRALLLGAGALIAGATMTKSVAGLFPGLGVAIYVLITGRVRAVVSDPRYVFMPLLALAPVGLFFVAREATAPGYLQAVWFNDFAGRSGLALDGHVGPPWYYLKAIFFDGLFSAGPLALLAPFGLGSAHGRPRRALVFALCCFAGQLLPISLSATKLVHYSLPALPWLAVACALTVHATLPRFLGNLPGGSLPRWKRIASLLLLAVAVINIGARVAIMRYSLLPQRQFYPQAGYGAVLSALHARGETTVHLVDPGIEAAGVRDYTPQLDFYAQLWRSRGMTVTHMASIPPRPPANLASCDPDAVRALLALGGKTIAFPGCAEL
jgi:4-amino-4-deoxy-L-arabinose transferase-like glycosyltransferase